MKYDPLIRKTSDCLHKRLAKNFGWKYVFNIVVAIRLILKAWQEITMKCIKTEGRKLCPSFSNKKPTDERHKLVKDIVITAQDRNMEV